MKIKKNRKINKALDDMKNDGTLQNISKNGLEKMLQKRVKIIYLIKFKYF